MFQKPSCGLGFGETPPQPLPGPSFSVLGEIRPAGNQPSFAHEVAFPLTWDDTSDLPPHWTQHWSEEHQHYYYFNRVFGACTWRRPTIMDEVDFDETNYLRFSLVDKVAASSAEAKLLWPLLRLPSWKPQGPACHLSRLGQGVLAQHVTYLIASFLWYEADPARRAAAHRSVSVDWADSCEIVWISSVGTHGPSSRRGLVFDPKEYSTSAGLWIHTNKDTFKLLDASEMGSDTTHQVEVAFQKGGNGWSPDGRWFVSVWFNGQAVGCGARVHPGDLRGNLDRGGPDGRSVVVRWIGGCGELVVADLQICAGELIPGVSSHVEWVD